MANERPGIRIVNRRKFSASLTKYARSLERELIRAAKRMMTRINRAAKRRAPVDMGLMRASIGHPEIGFKDGRVFGRLGSSQKYAKRTEFPNEFLKTAPRTGAGTVTSPYTSWPALRRRGGSGQTMPWLRPAFHMVLKKWGLRETRIAAKRASGR